MASSEDVRDIMGLPAQDTTITKDFILGQGQKKYTKLFCLMFVWVQFTLIVSCLRAIKKTGTFARPEGMHRELYNLLYSENKELPCPIIPTGITCFMSVL